MQVKSSAKIAKSLGIPYIESSARDGTNVEQVFLEIGKLVLDSMQSSNKLNKKIENSRKQLEDIKKEKKNDGCC